MLNWLISVWLTIITRMTITPAAAILQTTKDTRVTTVPSYTSRRLRFHESKRKCRFLPVN